MMQIFGITLANMLRKQIIDDFAEKVKVCRNERSDSIIDYIRDDIIAKYKLDISNDSLSVFDKIVAVLQKSVLDEFIEKLKAKGIVKSDEDVDSIRDELITKYELDVDVAHYAATGEIRKIKLN